MKKMDKIAMYGDYVAITPFQQGEMKTQAGIIIPEGTSENARKALVVDPGCLGEQGLATNDVILWTGMKIFELRMNNVRVLIVSQKEVMAKIVKAKKDDGQQGGVQPKKRKDKGTGDSTGSTKETDS